jgi:hypothetical protein
MTGGRFPMDRVAGFRWTRRPDSAGIGGRIRWNMQQGADHNKSGREHGL